MSNRPLWGMSVALLLWLTTSSSGQANPGDKPTAEAQDRIPMVHDIRDLLQPVMEFPMKPFNSNEEETLLVQAARQACMKSFTPERQWEARVLGRLRAHLRTRGIGGKEYTLQVNSGRLLVQAAPRVQNMIRTYLEMRRILVHAVVRIEARIIRIQDPGAGLPQSLEQETLGKEDTVFYLDSAQAATLLRELEAGARKPESGNKVLAAPCVMARNGQRAHVTLCRRQSYVGDYTVVKVLGEKESIVDPVVKTLDVGMGIEVRVELDAEDMNRARVEVHYQNAEIQEPIQKKQTQHGTVQIPRVNTISLQSTVKVALPGHVLLASRARKDRGLDLVLLGFKRVDFKSPKTKGRAAVKAVAPGGVDKTGTLTLFIDAGADAGLKKGAEVTFKRTGRSGLLEILFKGTVEKVYPDLAEVKARVPASGSRPDLDEVAFWWCTWNPRIRGKKI